MRTGPGLGADRMTLSRRAHRRWIGRPAGAH